MLTQTFILLAIALFAQRRRGLFWACLAGAVLPDVARIGAHVYALAENIAAGLVLIALFFVPAWQIANAILHDFWLWGALALIAYLLQRKSLPWSILSGFAMAGFLHCALDFLTRGPDAYMQFWPVSHWVFMSPIATLFATGLRAVELVAGAGLGLFLMMRFRGWPERVALALLVLSQAFLLVQFVAG